MKSRLILTLVFTIIALFSNTNVVNAVANQSDETKVILALLYPSTSKAIKDFYPGREFDLWNAKIKSLKQNVNGDNEFSVIVEYNTYTGPHNPPEGDVVIEYIVTLGDVKVKAINKV